MITSINEIEIERLLETAEKLVEVCKKNDLLSKRELIDIADQTYYFRKALEKGDFSFDCGPIDDEDEDEEDWDDDDEYEEDDV